MNIFDALNIFYREDTISDFLVNCFKDSSDFLIKFLNKAEVYTQKENHFNIETRVGLGKSIGTPDIVITASSDKTMKLVITENKMGAAEGHEQTNRYESKEAKIRIAKKYKLPVDNIEFHYIFLALDSTAKPKNSQFKFLDYQMFLEGHWVLNDDKLRLIFEDFQEKLETFYSPVKTPLESLETGLPMDGMQRKICWQSILYDTFMNNENLQLRWGEVGGAGRNNFLFLITKANWTSTDPFEKAGLDKTFNVHIDTYINMLDSGNNTVNEIGVRFETYPYVPHNKIKSKPEYQSFIYNKAVFSNRLFEYAKNNGILSKKRNSKLLVLALPIQGESIKESVANIKKQVEAIEVGIDLVIKEMIHEKLIG